MKVYYIENRKQQIPAKMPSVEAILFAMSSECLDVGTGLARGCDKRLSDSARHADPHLCPARAGQRQCYFRCGFRLEPCWL